MGFGWGWKHALRDISFILIFALTFLGENSQASSSRDFRESINRFSERINAIALQLKPGLSDSKRQELLKQVEVLMDEVSATESDFTAVMNKFIATAKTPAVTYLLKENAQIKTDLATLLGTSDETESDLKLDGLQFADHGTISQVQGYLALQSAKGDPSFGIELFELLIAKCEFVPRYLELKQIENLLNGMRGLTEKFYLSADEKFIAASQLLRQYFPMTPDFSLGRLSSQEDRNKVYTLFLQNFIDSQGRLPNQASMEKIESLVRRVSRSQSDMEMTRQRLFPKASADMQLNQLVASISHVPGSTQCFQLASGIASTTQSGAVCHPAQFYNQLNRTIHTYSNIAEPGLLVHIMEYVAQYRNEEFADAASKNAGFEELKKQIGRISTSMLAPDLAEAWKKARTVLITGDSSHQFRALLDSDAEGMQVMIAIQRVLLAHGIGVRQVGNQMVVAGTIRDYSPEIEAATKLRDGFQEHVIKPLTEYRLKEDPEVSSKYNAKLKELSNKVKAPSKELTQELLNEALLETLEGRMVALDSSGRFCSVLNNPSLSDPEKKQKSPWVVSARGADNREPTISNSSNGFQKLEYFTHAKIANVVAIQNSDRPRKMFAGLAVRTAVSSILPNVVQARLLLQDGWGEQQNFSLDAFGIKESQGQGVMAAVESKYTFPAYSQIVRDSREAWDEMLKRWASRNDKFSIPDSELEGLTKDERQTLIQSRFREQYKTIYIAYIEQYRRELDAAARLAQRWDKDIASLRQEPPKSAPDIFDQLGKSGLRVEGTDAVRGQNNVLQNIHEWIIIARRTAYLSKKDPNYRSSPDQDAKIFRMAETMAEKDDPKIDLTIPEFMEEFRKYGQRWVGRAAWGVYLGYEGDGGSGAHKGDIEAMFQLVMATREKRMEALEYARNLVLFRFPALRLNDAYKTYRGTRADFQTVVRAYYKNAVDQANRFQAMGAMTYWDMTKQFFVPMDGEEQQAKHIIDAVITNVPLLDIILKNFPDQLAFVCSEQANRDLWEQRVDAALATANGVGLMCSVISIVPGAQIVGLVGLGISAVSSTIQFARARAKWYEVEAAREFTSAAAPQLGFEADVRNWDYLAQLQKEADSAYYLAALEAGMTAVTAGFTALSYHRAARLATVQTGTKVTMRQLLARDLKQLGALTGKAKDGVVAGFRKMGLIQPETVGFQMRFIRAFPNLTYATNEVLMVEKATQTLMYVSDELTSFVWRLVGMRWTGRAHAGLMAGGSLLTWRFVRNYMSEFSMARQVSYVYDDPEHNRVFLEAVEGGWMSHDQLKVALEATRGYSKKFTQRAAIYDDLLAELSQAEKEGMGTVAEAKKNLKDIRDELVGLIKTLDPDSGESVAARRELREIQEMVDRWGG